MNMTALDRTFRPAIGVFALFLGAYVYSKFTEHPLSYLAEKLIPKGEFVSKIEHLARGKFNSVEVVITNKNCYALRRPYQIDPRSKYFERIHALSQIAAEGGFSPRLIGVDQKSQTLLLACFPKIPWPSFEQNPEPYKVAMKTLKCFHEYMKPYLPGGEIKEYSPFSFFLEKSTDQKALDLLPCQFITANIRMGRLFEQVKPWLKKNATYCHGDFNPSNILLSQEGKEYKTVIIDFDTTTIGHPFFDIANFTFSQTSEVQQQMLNLYLEREPNPEELKHYKFMRLALLMVITTNRLHVSQKKGVDTSNAFSKKEMEEILDSPEMPKTTNNVNLTHKDRQLQALYTLKEFLRQTEDPSLGLT